MIKYMIGIVAIIMIFAGTLLYKDATSEFDSTGTFFAPITTAVNGHVRDAVSRFTDDQIIEGKFTRTGTFDETADGQDFAHWAKGSVSIVTTLEGKSYVQLNPDFNSGPLPDGHVFISLLDSDINNESDFNFDTQIDLGELKKGKGASYYEIPNNLPATLIKSVTIWCVAFGEYIGSADIQ